MKRKTALITGGSRGLGRDMALSLAKAGTDIVFTYHSNIQAADEVVGLIEAQGQKALAIKFDANEPQTAKEVIKQTTQYLSKTYGDPNFDFLINNAGMCT